MEILHISNYFLNNQNHNNPLHNSNSLNIEILNKKSEHECKGSPGHFREPPGFPTVLINSENIFPLTYFKKCN